MRNYRKGKDNTLPIAIILLLCRWIEGDDATENLSVICKH